MVVDVTGLPIAIHIQPASVQDRDGALDVIKEAHEKFPSLAKIFADGGYAGQCEARVKTATGCLLDIVRRSDETRREVWLAAGQEAPVAEGFKLVKWRWIVERTFGWLGRYRRLSKDYEQSPKSALAWVKLAMVWMLARRLAAG